MGDIRKQIRHLDAQVQGFLLVARDFRQELIKIEKRVEELEKKLEEETDRSGEDHVL